ncbi:MAG: Phospho-N-acetylmuramoyl-pentapeptide-transferase [Candidatus Magasanikbacteria bacterium GW2011_GWA2_46_17]|uniref:Phospho-N-acetylmuramoyl-pentapeptide-transferase n=1 Tax=Candidatus Magasanikbacteria bacterium GW2011_GWA2_46_17 TaxID=1619042 RepID=A0A0G1NYL9_9BACT|nr:MAG: Phospho-N-acetylmuramoyl-pentapeptide-transferase [Candidatus Magasanikbacteria bacterium GW2011_GWA2_46_17]
MPFSPELLEQALLYLIASAIGAFLWAPVLTKLLYKYKVTRRADYDFTLRGEDRKHKVGTPIMGGLLVVVTVTVITLLYNWNRESTYVPIGVMGISALLGATDDLLNIFGKQRRDKHFKHVFTLIKVHKDWRMRLWYVVSLPWTLYRSVVSAFGSHPGKGVRAHEKLIFQFLAGAVTAWWIYYKLGEHWHSLWIPFDGQMAIGWWIIPIVIFFVMFTANAVNISDGLDGLAGSSLIATFAGLMVISWTMGRVSFTLLNATVIGALIAYTYFNIKPARFQMGDVGSLGLGALFAINAIAINRTLLILLLGFIFFIEIFSVIGQVLFRRLLGRRLFKMAPLHHHFEFRGWSEEKIVMRFALMHTFMVIVAVWVSLH